jgi:hypothetical protein
LDIAQVAAVPECDRIPGAHFGLKMATINQSKHFAIFYALDLEINRGRR